MKDTITNIFGVAGAVAGSILTAAAGDLEIPASVKAVCGIVAAVSVGVIGYFTGKTPTKP